MFEQLSSKWKNLSTYNSESKCPKNDNRSTLVCDFNLSMLCLIAHVVDDFLGSSHCLESFSHSHKGAMKGSLWPSTLRGKIRISVVWICFLPPQCNVMPDHKLNKSKVGNFMPLWSSPLSPWTQTFIFLRCFHHCFSLNK